jgi:ADP-ribosylglycohydrolase
MADMRSPGTLRDRPGGALLGLACGDALGVPHEFDHLVLGPDEEPRPRGGGPAGFAPGEWSDDTALAIAVAQGLATGGSLEERLDAVAGRFLDWYDAEPPDVGRQTRAVLSAVAAGPRTSAAMRAAATSYTRTHPHAAGNGALMRTAPVALAFLDDRLACAEAARAVAGLTHADPQAEDACVLWTEAIRVAVATGELAVAAGLGLVDDRWRASLAEAGIGDLGRFHPNGWAVRTVQVAYGAILRAGADFEEALATAIRVGDDTDTTAAVTGALLGALHGAAAVPQRWSSTLHGWPGMRAADLAELALRLLG